MMTPRRIFHSREMKITFIASILTLVIFDYCMDMTWSMNDKDDQDLQPSPRISSKSLIKRSFNSKKDKSLKSSQNKVRNKKSRKGDDGSSSTGTSRKGKGIEDSSMRMNTGNPLEKRKYYCWLPTHGDRLLHLYYTKLDISKSGYKRRRWPEIADIMNNEFNTSLNEKQIMRHAQTCEQNILKKIPLEEQQEGGIAWTTDLDAELLRSFYETKTGDPSEHERRLAANWWNEHSDTRIARVEPSILYQRAIRNMERGLKYHEGLTFAPEDSAIVPRQHQQSERQVRVHASDQWPMHAQYYEFLNQPNHPSMHQQIHERELLQGSQTREIQDRSALYPNVTLTLRPPSHDEYHG